MISPQETTRVRFRADGARQSDSVKPDSYESPLELEAFGEETPFDEEELSTLDEFEKIARKSSKASKSKRITRLDSVASDGKAPPSPAPRRQKRTRRRQIDPATCERDYTRDEIEFMNALSEYKRSSGRMFPTCSEILEVLKSLGYEKTAQAECILGRPEPGE